MTGEITSRFNRRAFLLTVGGIFVTGGATLAACTQQDVIKVVAGLAKLPDLINAYRKQNGLGPIPLSDAMTAVAMAHALDLVNYNPGASCSGNNHSWSSNGNWTSGCYIQGNQSTYPIMWKKPQEIAGYSGNGYEIVAWRSTQITPELALEQWKNSTLHNDVILNHGIWSTPWKALGAIVAGNYACAWFGKEED